MMAKALPQLRWLPALLWMAVIFILSNQSDLPRPPDPTLAEIAYTAAHFLVYSVLAALLYCPLHQNIGPERGWQARVLVFALAVAYGLSDEFHQSFVPHREPSLADWLTDATGAAWALWSVPLVAPRAGAGLRRLQRMLPLFRPGL